MLIRRLISKLGQLVIWLNATSIIFFIDSTSSQLLSNLEENLECSISEKPVDDECEDCTMVCGIGLEPDSELPCEKCITCGGDTYSNEVGTDTCQPCSGCYTGETMIKDCTPESDTECRCIGGYLNEAHKCIPCIECLETEEETTPCNLFHGRVCEIKQLTVQPLTTVPDQDIADGLTTINIAVIATVSILALLLLMILIMAPVLIWCWKKCKNGRETSFLTVFKDYYSFIIHCCNFCKRDNGQSQGSNQDPEIRGAYYSRGISNGNAIGNGTAEGVRLIMNPRNSRDSIDDDDNDNDQSQYLDENIDVEKNTYFLHKLDYLFSGVKNFINKLAHNGGVSKITIDDIYKNYSTNAEEARYQLWLEWARTTPRKFQEIAQCELFPPELKSNLIKIAKECSQGKKQEERIESSETNVEIKDMCETDV